jgi:hypothetical protein
VGLIRQPADAIPGVDSILENLHLLGGGTVFIVLVVCILASVLLFVSGGRKVRRVALEK